jgi:ribosomal protein S18 acetylase RimI-like enzyme
LNNLDHLKNPQINIVDYRSEFQVFFENLYVKWFRNHFQSEPEPIDWALLKDPNHSILEKGGILLIGTCNDAPAGSLALKKLNEETFELTKMVIDEKFRGLGIGEALCREAIDRAVGLGAKRLILYSHNSLEAALRLYRKLGFTEVPLEQGLYSHFRCNVKMEFLFDQFAINHTGKDPGIISRN